MPYSFRRRAESKSLFVGQAPRPARGPPAPLAARRVELSRMGAGRRGAGRGRGRPPHRPGVRKRENYMALGFSLQSRICRLKQQSAATVAQALGRRPAFSSATMSRHERMSFPTQPRNSHFSAPQAIGVARCLRGHPSIPDAFRNVGCQTKRFLTRIALASDAAERSCRAQRLPYFFTSLPHSTSS